MPDNNLDNILKLYNPWWEDARGDWRKDLPDYRRPVVNEILSDIAELPQIISVTGPRRVGKTTALRQVICNLLDKENIEPKRILYFSFDDPEVFGSEELQRIIFDRLVERAGARQSQKIEHYFFLDEIQRLPKCSGSKIR
ncbi:MAG: AAA family ATPase [Desulfobacterales bacterium]|nr:AAA family ATPase [Desulfobacterales bacterium]